MLFFPLGVLGVFGGSPFLLFSASSASSAVSFFIPFGFLGGSF
jgi:hypothetical protein